MIRLSLTTPYYEKLQQDFSRYIRSLGYSSKTGKPYFPNHLREFLFFLEQKAILDLKQVTAQEIIAYHNYLKERPNARRGGGLADTTITHHLLSLRIFFDYLLDMKILDASPARLPNFNLGKGRQREIVTVEEIQLIYAACTSKRDRAILALSYGAGLRRTEAQDLNTADVNLNKGMLTVRDGKGGRARVVPLSDAVIKDLKEYLVYERPLYFPGNKTTPAFLVNNHGTRMKGDKISARAKEIVNNTGNPALIKKNISLHNFRHSIAVHLVENGADIEVVQKFLGHKSIDMSHYYARLRKRKTRVFKQFG